MSLNIDLSGKWRMNGRQTNVPRSDWEAELLLRQNGSLVWKGTKGSNVGATRSGRWSYDDRTFTMNYAAPRVGLVEWKSDRVTQASMNGTYRTPKAGPQPIGWGGVWSANRSRG